MTRDALDVMQIYPKRYFARSSLVSICAKPIDIAMESIDLKSEFQKRIVYWDISKMFQKYSKNVLSKYLIVDLIDERFPVYETNGTYITASSEYNRSGVDGILHGKAISTDRRKLLWKDALLEFKSLLGGYQKVILHEAYWRTDYIDEMGNIQLFANGSSIEGMNDYLQKMYADMKHEISDLKVICVKGYHASKIHKWGLAPMHYEESYYWAFMKEMENYFNT